MTGNTYAAHLTTEEIEARWHRAWVGGFWEEIGRLQFEFLVARGLVPTMTFLDIGCGAFRGGVHFIRYLDSGNYYGIDRNESLLRAGTELELPAAGLTARLLKSNLLCDENFDFQLLRAGFDMALAHSVFTHIDRNTIRLCLANLASVMNRDGVFYATFFERPPDHPLERPLVHPPLNVETHSASDPYHYTVGDFEALARDLPWRIEIIGDWEHPRGQKMLAFHKQD